MKNILLLFILFYSGINLANAQENKLEIGGVAGANFSRFYSLKNFNSSITEKAGLSFAAAFQYNINSIFSARAEFGLERKGMHSSMSGQVKDENGNPVGMYRYTLYEHMDYFTFPVLARASFGEEEKFFVNAGPYFGFLVAKTNKIFASAPNQFPLKAENNNMDGFKRADFGFSFGAGVSIPANEQLTFTLEIRDNLGLMNIGKISSARNHSLALLAGFNYSFMD
mgnify:CR=1 FL=1